MSRTPHRPRAPRRTRLALAATAIATGFTLLAVGAGSGVATARPASGPGALADQAGLDGNPTCRGVPADVVVGPGEEYIGTEGDDVIVVVGPDALVWGQLGDDLICVHQPDTEHYGGSVINGSFGADTIITYGGNNTINAYGGDADDDFVYLNGDHEYVDTGDGNDVVYAGGALVADIHTGTGNDYVVGSPGGDLVEAGSGNDVVLGASGDDELSGEDGNDVLYGNAGFDDVDGGAHYDECFDHSGAQGASFSGCENAFVSLAVPGGLKFG